MTKKRITSRQIPVLAAVLLAILMLVVPFSPISANALTTVDLSGTWTFTPQGGSATTIQVPGGGWYKQGFTSVNEADYQRTITIPNTGQPQVTKIEFGAINYEASLYINNNLVATQRTSFTPSVFDITNFVTPGNSCTLRVHVKGKNASSLWSGGRSLVPNAAGWCPNTPQGIFRSAQIVVYPQIYISDVFVRPSVQNSNLNYDIWVTNASSSSKTFTISSNLSSWNGTAFSYPGISDQSFTVSANTTSKITVGPINWGLGTSSFWWPNVPYQSGYTAQLHNLNLTLKESGVNRDTKTVRFGFKEVVQRSDGSNTNYYLNGIRVNFRGDSFQGANYDGINYGGGVSDAYDTLPGFLPGTNGWPKAVDNFQRLNYNFARLHQEPVTPYMLDVCDEKGLMVMEETAIRGSSNDQDFVNGHDNMVNHLKALFTRDRNHACIVRWSQSNEPDLSNSDSTQFETDLYNAAMSVDNTRPISIDPFSNSYETMNYSNFSIYRHYASGCGNYTDEVFARTDRPYGQGEIIWPNDNTKQGFTWFATATQAMRRKNASDIRPYTLLSAWVGVIPGVKTTDVYLEQGGYPVYGENNLPDPWSNYQIKRVQAGFNPVLVADRDYWEANKLSNSNGDWPVNTPSLSANTNVTRTLDIFNDTFSGTTVDVYWEVRSGSATGTLLSSGELHPNITPGYMSTQNITFTTPGSGNIYLVLYSKKSGVELFRETNIVFTVGGSSTQTVNDNTTGTGNNQFEFVGSGWSYGLDNRCYSGDDHWSSTANDYCQVRFNGAKIQWLGAKAPEHGIMAVSIDGGSETVIDCYQPSRQDQVVLYDSGTLNAGQHTLKVRVTGTRNANATNGWINADEVIIYNNPTGATLYLDDFEGDTIGQNAAGWTPNGGTWQVLQPAGNTKEYQKIDSGDNLSLTGDAGWANYYVQGYVNLVDETNGGVCLLGRVQDGSHYYQVELKKDGSGNKKWWIWKNDGGTWTEIASGAYTYNANTYYYLRLRMVGSTIEAFVSADYGTTWSRLGGGSDSRYGSGKIGLRSWGSGGRFDVIQVVSQ